MDCCLSVRAFGAKGDGTVDDTKALQSALDKAFETGTPVWLEPGRYRTGPLTVRAGTVLKSDPTWDYSGGGRTVLLPANDGQRCVLDMNEAYGATLEGFCVCGENRGENMCGLLMDRGTFVREDSFRLEKLKVFSFTGHGIWLDCVWCFSMRHCMSAFNGGDGLRIMGWDAFLLDNWLSGNGGAGYGAYGGNASVTLTGNRIEWNKKGGIVVCGGSQYNITGNYIDRSGCGGIVLSGRAGDKPGDYRYSNIISVTGNVIYRSGKDAVSEEDSCHMLLSESVGLTVTGNTMCLGRDDGWKGRYSPDYGMILSRLGTSYVAGNTMLCGALKKLVWDKGGHGGDLCVGENPGTLVPPCSYAENAAHPLSIPHMMAESDDPWYRETFAAK